MADERGFESGMDPEWVRVEAERATEADAGASEDAPAKPRKRAASKKTAAAKEGGDK